MPNGEYFTDITIVAEKPWVQNIFELLLGSQRILLDTLKCIRLYIDDGTHFTTYLKSNYIEFSRKIVI